MIARDNTDPDLRRGFALGANAGWITLCGAFGPAMLVVGLPVRVVLGDATGNVVLAACLAGAMFCIAVPPTCCGACIGTSPQARRRARRNGVDSKGFATSMRRKMPRNSSLIFQAWLGI
jgi:hypothetical protein